MGTSVPGDLEGMQGTSFFQLTGELGYLYSVRALDFWGGGSPKGVDRQRRLKRVALCVLLILLGMQGDCRLRDSQAVSKEQKVTASPPGSHDIIFLPQVTPRLFR